MLPVPSPAPPSSRVPPAGFIAALRQAVQAHSLHPVELIETHISWLLLADERVYKLKKPVCLPFVDFRPLAVRKHCCEEELRLNRRLAPSIYLDVVPVCGTPEAPRIGAGGPVIDYAVCMRRFPKGALLAERLQAGCVEPAQLDAFAQRLAQFHRAAPVAGMHTGYGTAAQVQAAVGRVLASLGELPGASRVAAIRAWVDARMQALHGTLAARSDAGAVRECHGDLHLANVVFNEGEFQSFDAIEFDPALRWIDTMSDTAFLTMDLRAHGRADLAWRFLDAYFQHGGDHAGIAVLRLYEVYRALVRAMVHGLAPAQADAADYLGCAQQLLDDGQAPRLLITHGLSGSGKSSVAAMLVERAGAIRLRSDVERKRLFGLGPLDSSARAALDIYGPQATRATFARLAEGARTALAAGYRVIVDAAFLRRAERTAFRELAGELNVPFSILDCTADVQTLRRRIEARAAAGTDPSEADHAVLERQIAFQEPLDEQERRCALAVMTQDPIDGPALCARWLAAA